MVEHYFKESAVFSKYVDIIYSDREYEQQIAFIDRLLKKRGISGKIIDLGCGTGTHLELLAKKGYSIIGIDNSRAMIHIARKKTRGKFMVCSMDKIKLKGIGAAISLYCSINYNNKKQLRTVLKNVYDGLEKNGIMIIETRDVRNISEKPRVVIKKIGKKRLINITIWEKNGQEKATYTVILFIMVGNKLKEYIVEEHKLCFLNPSILMNELKRIGFKVLFYNGFNIKNEVKLSSIVEEPVIIAFKK